MAVPGPRAGPPERLTTELVRGRSSAVGPRPMRETKQTGTRHGSREQSVESDPQIPTTPRIPTMGAAPGLHSRSDPHGRTASDTTDGSLKPAAFSANARQT